MKKLNEDIKNRRFEKVYLLYGNEPYLVNQYKKRLTEAVVGSDDTLNVTRFSGKKTEASDIIDACMMLPFLSERRAVIAEDTEFFGKRAGRINEYFKDIPDTTVLIFVESQADARSKAFKAVKDEGYAAKLDTPDADTLFRWSQSLLKQADKRISESTLRYFLENTEPSMENIANEFEKLFSYMGERRDISAEDVREICSFRLEDKVYEMIEMIEKGRSKRALELYNVQLKLKDSQRGIITLFIRQFERLLQIRELYDRGMSGYAIADTLGLKKWIVDKDVQIARGFSRDELKGYLDGAVNVIDDVNSGRMDEKTATDMYVCSILNRGQ